MIEVLDQGIGQIGSIGATSLHFTFAKGDVWPFLQTVVVPAPLARVMFVGTIAAFFAIGLAGLGFEVRRFHDFAWSGWCVLLNIPLALIPFPNTPGVIPEVATLVWFAMMVAVPGTRGRNRYGPDPRDPIPDEIGAVFDGEPAPQLPERGGN